MIFKSQQVNLDPAAYRNRLDGTRWPDNGGDPALLPHDPRPEFEPTRDPMPYAGVGRMANLPRAAKAAGMRWAPRRDQFDTPVNPLLVAFREEHSVGDGRPTGADLAEQWVGASDAGLRNLAPGVTPEQIDHAKKVLTRLANWKETALKARPAKGMK